MMLLFRISFCILRVQILSIAQASKNKFNSISIIYKSRKTKNLKQIIYMELSGEIPV
jgi:hypothetical protein